MVRYKKSLWLCVMLALGELEGFGGSSSSGSGAGEWVTHDAAPTPPSSDVDAAAVVLAAVAGKRDRGPVVGGQWACSRCTYINPSALMICDMCEVPRAHDPKRTRTDVPRVVGGLPVPKTLHETATGLRGSRLEGSCFARFRPRSPEHAADVPPAKRPPPSQLSYGTSESSLSSGGDLPQDRILLCRRCIGYGVLFGPEGPLGEPVGRCEPCLGTGRTNPGEAYFFDINGQRIMSRPGPAVVIPVWACVNGHQNRCPNCLTEILCLSCTCQDLQICHAADCGSWRCPRCHGVSASTQSRQEGCPYPNCGWREPRF